MLKRENKYAWREYFICLWILVFSCCEYRLIRLLYHELSHASQKKGMAFYERHSCFFVALFTEMYGFPLTIYILTGVLGSKYPALNPFSHASGHLWVTFLGGGAAMLTIIHLISDGLVIIGFIIMWKGWKLIHAAKGVLVTEGPYAYVRHPQYSGLFLVMIGMLIQCRAIRSGGRPGKRGARIIDGFRRKPGHSLRASRPVS